MSITLTVCRGGPGLTVQDAGRPGRANIGLSRGGAADRTALVEAAALLGLARPGAALEMTVMGGSFEVSAPTRFALTGAPMLARIGDRRLAWMASHRLDPGQRLTIGAARGGTYGYLSFAGGIETAEVLGSRSANLAAGLGAALEDGTELPLGDDAAPDTPALCLPAADRFEGGTLRYVYGPQTGLFAAETVARFEGAGFTRARSGNRQGVKLDSEAGPFPSDAPKGLASEFIFEGDIQMTGAGEPYVLLVESQTMGGYPRIGTVVPRDLPIIAQATPGTALNFRRVALEEYSAHTPDPEAELRDLKRQLRPLTREPGDIPDLLSYQLISGVTAGDDLEEHDEGGS